MAKQNVELQLMALERLKQELESLVKDIENRGNSYVASVKALMQTDLDVNVTNQYKNNYWQQNNALMAQLKQRIETQDIPYIDRCITGAKQALVSYKE
jgi:FPC/CPF motif-containing protein YcgG